MEEIALLNPRRKRVRRRASVRSPVRRRSVRAYRAAPMRRRRLRRNPIPSMASIKGIFSKESIMNWVYLGGGFMVGVAAEKSLGERISSMFRVNIPIADTFIRQLPLIAGVALFGKSMPKSAMTGIQAYIGYRLVNSALQMANINLSGVSEGIGYTPQFGLSGLYEPTSSPAPMPGGSEAVFEPSF